MRGFLALAGLLTVASSGAAAFAPSAASASGKTSASTALHADADGGDRRAFLSSAASAAAASVGLVGYTPAAALAADDDDSESSGLSIAQRAARLSREVTAAEEDDRDAEELRMVAARERLASDTRTIYDFTLPVKGEDVTFGELIGQEYGPDKEDGSRGEPKVKAVLLVNIKQDDVVARKNIPELIALAQKYGKNGEFAVICCPTDQGYYEPDTSALLRLKLASEYGYGSPTIVDPRTTLLSDKVNLLGTGAHPLWRWLQNRARTPDGLGRIEANFEKFLVDMRTGQPVRRYPRKYFPYDMKEDVEALVAGKRLPPLTAEWREEWRSAVKAAEADTYRFQKGLNVFDQ